MEDGYRGVVGAIPFAFGQSDSYLFKSYAVVGTLVAAFIGTLFVLGVIVLLGQTGGRAGTLSFSRSFVLLVGVLLVAPLLAPTLLVARRHRRGTGHDRRYDAAMAASGYLFLLAVYAGGVASMPECFLLDGETVCRPPPEGLTAPVVATLYAVPQLLSPVFPLVAALLIGVFHRLFR
ncbi:putative membrane protein [Halalkaliarchaeum sp. AArc-CO]|uniref:hypothetical protein n=1 Tax=unclassified Halalkaliarchaeum TaxID=2678344 RepID=UPI00217E30A2|nr:MULTISPECIES: hypothetical protein [unclassified Halalkaliarchaeum]MDR5672415.1 hypothetical protein [Halalkaliarchaeum sp. AArc-GB]UWG49952.1 putative membrane protein [Halalkaliarchaeum sp. AArc-CO]